MSHTALAVTYDYTAKVRGSAKLTGVVTASGIQWRCVNVKGGGKCTVSGPWPTPGISACAALAQKVGEITYYGHAKKRLSSGDLQRCNQGLTSAQVPKLAAPLSSLPKSGTSTTTSTAPLAIKNTDPNTLQALKGAPPTNQIQQSTGTSNPPTSGTNNTLSTVQAPSKPGSLPSGQTSSMPQLDNKIGGSGLDRDQLRSTAQDKRETLTDLTGGRSIIDPHPTTGKPGVIPAEPKLDGKLDSIRPESLQPLKGDSIGTKSGILPLDQPKSDPSTNTTLRDPRLKLRKSSDLTALKGDAPPGDPVSSKDTLQISKNIDIGKLQPLNSTSLTTISPEASIATPTVKGLTPPEGGLKPPSPSTTSLTSDLAGTTTTQSEKIALANSVQNIYSRSGPYIERIGGFDQCVRSGETIELHGTAFGDARDERRVMLARVGQTVASLFVTQWTNTRITARLPTFSGSLQTGVPYQVAIRDPNDQRWLSNVNQSVIACSGSFAISGFVNFSNLCAPSASTISALPAPTAKGETVSHNIIAQTQSKAGLPAQAGQHHYRIGLKSPGNYRVRIGNPPQNCAGQWQQSEFVVNVPSDYGNARQDFRFLDGSQAQFTSRLGFKGAGVELTMYDWDYCQCPRRASDRERICTPFNEQICYRYTLSHSIRTVITLRSDVRNCSVEDINVRVSFFSGQAREMNRTVSIGGCIEAGQTRVVAAEFPGVNHNLYALCEGPSCAYSYINPGTPVQVNLSTGNTRLAGNVNIGTSPVRTVTLRSGPGRVYWGHTGNLSNATPPSSQVGGTP